MRKILTLVLAAGFVIYLLAAGAAKAADTKAADYYKQNCLKCHGEQGKGDGPTTKTIKNMKMADWTNKEAMAKFSDDDLFKIISEGGAGVGKSKIMPSYKAKLKEQEIKDEVVLVRSFSKK